MADLENLLLQAAGRTGTSGRKNSEIKKTNTYVYSAAAVKQMLQEKKSTASRPLNVAQEKDRLRKLIEITKLHNDDAEVERVQARMKELEEFSRRFEQKDEKAKKLAEMNRKTRAENLKNASEMKPVNTNLKAGEAGHDPFSRRWTRSSNYYVSRVAANGGENGDAAAGPGDGDSVGPANGVEAGEAATATALKAGVAWHDPFSRRWTRSSNYYVSRAAANGGENGDAAAGPGDGDSVGPTNGVKAGEAATATALKAGAGAGKLVDTKAPVDQGTESNSLHNFDLPISQVVQLGFLARKQRIEATIGYKVPDNDGR